MTFKDIFSSRNILIILILILIVLNLFLFLIYQDMNPKMSFTAQIFSFLGTRTFQSVTISLVLPILMFLIDYIFKFREKYNEEQKRRSWIQLT